MSAWNECESISRHYDPENGRETILTCDLGRHETPGDMGVEHHDGRLGVYWRWDDEGGVFEDDE